MMTLGPLSRSHRGSIAVRWVSNGNERDAYAYPVYLFTAIPRWAVELTPTHASLRSVRAVSRTVAWASGGNDSATAPVVVRTVDGGQNWTDVTGGLTGADFYTIFAIDETHAWVGSGDGRIFATTNGGVSWVQQAYPGIQSPFIDGIWFFDVNNGFALGDPATGVNKYVLLKTTNGGATWTHLPNEPVAGAGEAGWNNSFWWADPLHGWFGTKPVQGPRHQRWRGDMVCRAPRAPRTARVFHSRMISTALLRLMTGTRRLPPMEEGPGRSGINLRRRQRWSASRSLPEPTRSGPPMACSRTVRMMLADPGWRSWRTRLPGPSLTYRLRIPRMDGQRRASGRCFITVLTQHRYLHRRRLCLRSRWSRISLTRSVKRPLSGSSWPPRLM